jgi:hypothetical protein
VSDRERESEREHERDIQPENIRVLRLGHGGNCSSVGSVIDTLFLTAAVGGAIFAAVCAAMREERVVVVGEVGDEETKTKTKDDP